MDSFFEKKLITTKDASELSGYTSDYLGRLVRSGKIEGQRIGHNWLIERESLASFLKNQKTQKSKYARSLSLAREEEYRAHRSFLHHKEKSPKPSVSIQTGIRESSVFSQIFALAIALLVVASGAFAAQAVALPQLGEQAAEIAHEASSGFRATFGDIPYNIAARIDAASASMRATNARVAAGTALASARFAPSLLAKSDFSLPQNLFPAGVPAQPQALALALVPFVAPAPVSTLTFGEVQSSALGAYAFLTSPARMAGALVGAYVALGAHAYNAITASFAAYQSLIVSSGPAALALGATARDTLAKAPHVVNEINLAFGESIIRATHAAIRADVAGAYGLAAAAPASARVTVALVGGIGDTLAGMTARTPALATTVFLRTTQAPATLAPALAQAVFSGEYAVALRFVAITDTVSGHYLALVSDTGTLAYAGTAGVLALANVTPPLFAHAPAAIENAYLGLLGNGALALDSFPAHLARLVSVKNTPALAAVLPALSAGEQAALFTYQTIHGFFNSATGALASLFGTPNVAVVSNPPPVVLPFATSTAPAAAPQSAAPARVQHIAVTNYPTYTTVVQGVSQDFVNQSLASLRANILATVAGMIQPVAAQGATNENTIQYVNMIQDLSNLTVRNGNFLGGTFDNGNLTNGISVSATSGSFTHLTGGNTSLATTSITGSLSTTGNVTLGGTLTAGSLSVSSISSGGAISAPYFTATSSAATSTFGGSLNVGNGGFVYATSTRNVGIGVLSPAALLALQNSTSTQPIFVANNAAGAEVYRITDGGFVGIGTTSPAYALSVEGSSSLGNNAIAGYFTATSSAATSTFNGSLAVGTSTQFANGLFAAGTSSPLLYVDSTTGRIGIGTSSPAVALDIFATDAIRLPVGTSAQRPLVGDTGYVRYNTTTQQFEGYGANGVWQGLGGVIDANQDTKITADTNNLNEDYLRFFTDGVQRMTITNTGLIGIGSTSPFAQLSLAGNAGSTTNLFAISTSTALFATTTALTIDANGNLALLNGANLSVGGNLVVSGNTTLASATSTAFAITSLPNALLSTNANGSVVASTSIGVNYLSGVLPIANGGTNSSSQTTNGIAYYDGSKLTTGSNLSYNGSQLTLDLVDSWGGLHIQGRSGGEASIALQPDNVGNGSAGQWILETNGNGLNNQHDFCWYSSELGRCTFNLVSANGYAGFNTDNPIAPLSVNGGFFATASSTIGGGTQTSGLTIVGGATTTLSQYIGGTLTVSGNTTLANATTTNLFSTTASSTNLFASNAQFGSLAVLGNTTNTGLSIFQNGFLSQSSSTVAGNFTTTGSTYLATLGGNVGIGTTSPTARVAITGLGTGTSQTFAIANSLNQNIFTVQDNSQAIFGSWTSGNNALVVNPSSASFTQYYNLTDSRYALSSNGWNDYGLQAGGANLDGGALRLGSGGSYSYVSGGGSGLGRLNFFTSGSVTVPALSIIPTGNVGIGTTSPSALLSLGNGSGAAGTTAALGINFGDPTANLYRQAAGVLQTDGSLIVGGGTMSLTKGGNDGSLRIAGGSNEQLQFGAASSGITVAVFGIGATNASYGSAVQTLNTGNTYVLGTNGTNLVAVLNSGNVGIGTTSPYRTLSVSGSGVFTGGDVLASTLTATSSVTAPTINATSALQLNGTSINTAGTLSNVAYLNQANTFTALNQFNAGASTTQLTLGLGSVNAPSIVGTGGTNTGIFFRDNQRISFASNGAEQFEIVSTLLNGKSNSIIGWSSNTDPATSPDIALARNAAGVLEVNNGITGTLRDITVRSASTTGQTVLATLGGNVGIGTANPAQKLDVAGNINTSAGSAYMYNGANVITASTTLNNYFFAGAGNLTMTGNLNIASGRNALAANTTGYFNLATGFNALAANTTGYYNVANGIQALFNNTTGFDNIALGTYALDNNTTGSHNIATGYYSLLNNSTGSYNTALGTYALNNNITGTNNTAISPYALSSNTTGSYNTASGYAALSSNTSATSSVALGYAAGQGAALYSNQGGTYLGYQSGYSAATGSNYNTLVGYNAGYDITTGANNIVLGTEQTTGSGLTTGSNNILIGTTVSAGLSQTGSNQLNIGNLIFGTNLGTGATLSTGNVGIGNTAPATRLDITNSANSAAAITLRDSSGAISLELRASTSTLQNTFVGYQAAPVNTTGAQNTALGYQALSSNTTGFYSTALGFQSLYSNTTGFDNIALGYQALYSNTTGTGNTATGWGTLYANNTGTNNTANGYYAMQNNTTGYNNTASGYQALSANTTGSRNTATGMNALYSNTTGYNNTATGEDSLWYNTTGNYNTASGYQALNNNTTGTNNTANGVQALFANNIGTDNTASGYSALWQNTSGSFNTADGEFALYSNTTGYNNAALGYQSLYKNTTGPNNTVLGYGALYWNNTATSTAAVGAYAAYGTGNYSNQGGTYLGYQSGYSAATGSDYNTLVGFQSGYGDTTGTRNVLIGPSTIAASYNQVTTGSNNIAIGNDVAVASPTASNQLNIGNLIYGTGLNGTGATLSTGNVGIGTTTPWAQLSVNPNGITGPAFAIGSSTATNFIVTNGGNVGIGTAAPQYPLDIYNQGIEAFQFQPAAGTPVSGQSLFFRPGGTGNVPAFGTTAYTFAVVAGSGYNVTLGVPGGANTAIFPVNNSYVNQFTFTGGASGVAPVISTTGSDSNINMVLSPKGSGNIGIGTTSPWRTLSVNGSSDLGTNALAGYFTATSTTATSTFAGFIDVNGTGTNATSTFASNLWVKGALKVGIASLYLTETGIHSTDGTINIVSGTTATSSFSGINAGILNVSSTTATSTFANGINLSAGCFAVNGTCVGGGGGGSGTTGQFPYYAANGTTLTATSSLFLATSGNVGIGTTSPATIFTVAGTGANSGYGLAQEEIQSGASEAGLYLRNDGANGRGYNLVSTSNASGIGGGRFAILDVAANATRLLIDSSGNVGIGTTSPATTLSVAGNGYLTGGLGVGMVNSNPGSLLTSGGATINGGIDLIHSGIVRVGTISNDTSGFILENTSANPIIFQTNGANERMRIDASGNVGIGTTSPWAQLSVNPNGITGPAFAIGSSTATNFIVTNGGNVGIGTMSPSQALNVVGNGLFTGTLTASNLNQTQYTVAVPSTIGDAIEFATVTNSNFSSNVEIWLTIHSGGYAQSKRYIVPVAYNGTAGAWQKALPISTTGAYSGNDAEIDVMVSNQVATFAIMRTAGTTAGIASISLAIGGDPAGTTVTAVSTTLPALALSGNYAPTSLTMNNGNTGINNETPTQKLDVAGNINTSAGSAYMYNGLNVITASTTLTNYFFGGAGNLTMMGQRNTASGNQALFNNTTGSYNTASGMNALYYNTTGSTNTASGYQALFNNTTGTNNTASGVNAILYNTSATSSVALGYAAGQGTAAYSNQGGTYLGFQSGYSAATGSDYNTLVGFQSGYGVTTGTRNVLIGPSTIAASYNQVTTGSNNIAIGNDVAVASPTASNQLNIGNLIYGTGLNGTGATLSTGNIGIGTSTPSSTLTIQAPAGQTALTIASSTGATMLSVNADGSLTAKLNQLTSDYLVDSGSATINVGDLVAYVNGKAQKARSAIIAGTPVDANAVLSTQESAAALSSTSFVMAYYNTSTGFINAVVGTVSGTTITYGTPVALSASIYPSTNVSVAALSSTAFVISYQAVSTIYAQAVVGTVSGTTITYGTPAALNAVSSSYTPVAALSSTSFAVAYYNNSTNYANAVVATVSGTTITPGTPAVMSSGTIVGGNFSIAALSSSLFVVGYTVSGPTTYAVAGSVSGTTITAGTPYGMVSTSSTNVSIAPLSSTTFIVEYLTSTINAIVGTVSGTTITAGNTYSISAPSGTASLNTPSVAAFSATSFVATYTTGSSYYINAVVGTVSGTVVTLGQNVVLNNVNSTNYPGAAAALSSSTFVVGYRNSSSGYAEAFAAQSVTPSSNIIGMATTAASPGGIVTVASNGIVTGLSGLTAGSTYYDGLALGLSTTTSTYKVGLALSSSSILLNSSNGAGTDQFFGDAVFANNFRITEAPGAPQGLLFENQLGRQVMSIDEAGNLTLSGGISASSLNLADVSTLGQELLASATTTTATTTQNAFDFASGMATILNSRFNFNAFNALAASTSTPSVLSLYQGTTTPAITITASGTVGIGTTSPNHTLTVAGDVGAIAFVNTSTRSAKDDISYVSASTTDQMFGQLLQLRAATYRYKIENQNDPLRLGFIAEDAQTIAPEILSPDGKGVDLYKLATFTLSGVQVLAARQADLAAQVSSLAARVAKLENGSISIASASPVSFSSSTLASALSGFGVLIQKGIAQFGTVVANQFVAATDTSGASSAGNVTILAGTTVAQVNNAYAQPTTKVFVTFNAPVTGSWWVSDKAAGSFRVILSAPQANDVSFDYFLVQTQGQIATSTPDGTFAQGSSSQSSGAPSGSTGTSISGPVITLLGANPVHVPVGGTFVEPGVTVTDSVDGTDPYITFINGIQQAVSSTTIDTSSPTTYIITYKATDQAGNSSTALRSVIVGNPDGTTNLGPAPATTSGSSTTSTSTTTSAAASTASSTPTSTAATSTPPSADTTPPVVTLNGAAAMMLTVGGTFTDPGATATDNVDGNLTSKIKETGAVDTATVGLYTLTYSATDAAGNTGSASRVVTVAAATSTPTTASTTSSTSTTTPATATPTTTTTATGTASSTPTTSTASSTSTTN